MALPANFVFRVLHANKNGLTKAGRFFRSLPKSVYEIIAFGALMYLLRVGLQRFVAEL